MKNYYLLSIQSVAGTYFHNKPWCVHHYYLHFTDEGSEASEDKELAQSHLDRTVWLLSLGP